LKDLKPAHFFRGHIRPGNAEMRCAELQRQQTLQQPPGVRMPPAEVQIVQLAVRATVDRQLPGAALRAPARRG
jgi:hypothetical protein